MKSIVIYYSYSGNTKKAADVLTEYIRQEAETEVVELKVLDESDKFLSQAARAFRRKRGEIEPVNFDLGAYGLICLGTPVWAFGPAPAMNTYLDKCFGLKGKTIILFATYGSGAGKGRCLNYMQEILTKKGASQFKRLFIQQFRVSEKDYVLTQIKKILPLLSNG
ncbi:MAG: flavodoxin [Candidatus Omnitrophota bacterium]